MNKGGNYRFIITGGPGSGKTALIECLAKSGYNTFPELARKFMKEGIDPPLNLENSPGSSRFAREIIKERIKQHEAGRGRGISFYDRGLPDSLGFMAYMGIKASDSFISILSGYPYNEIVFFLPPWKEIYKQDEIRRENFDTACKISACIEEAYIQTGYKLVEVPRGQISERASFIEGYLEDIGLLSDKAVGN